MAQNAHLNAGRSGLQSAPLRFTWIASMMGSMNYVWTFFIHQYKRKPVHVFRLQNVQHMLTALCPIY